MRPVDFSVGDKEKWKDQARVEGYPTVGLSSLREGVSTYLVGQSVLP